MAASLQMESSTTSWAGQTLCGGSVLTRSSSEWATLVSGSQNVPSKLSHRFDLDQSINHFYCHITTVSEILESMLQTVQKQFTYRQYILTQKTMCRMHIHSQYTQCTIRHTCSYQYTFYIMYTYTHNGMQFF